MTPLHPTIRDYLVAHPLRAHTLHLILRAYLHNAADTPIAREHFLINADTFDLQVNLSQLSTTWRAYPNSVCKAVLDHYKNSARHAQPQYGRSL